MKLLPRLHPERCSTQEQVHPPPSLRVALRREWRRLCSRPGDLALATWLPLAVAVFTGAMALALPPSEIEVAVVDADHSLASRQLLRRLDAGPELAVSTHASLAEARTELLAGRAEAALLVPPGFGAALAAEARAAALGAAVQAERPSAAATSALRLPAAESTAQVELALAPSGRARDARLLAHLRGVLDSLAAEADTQASALFVPAAGGRSPAPSVASLAAVASPLVTPPLGVHLDAPALQARADSLVLGSAVLLLLLHLSAALLMANGVGREFSDRSASQWLAASGRRWRIALAAKALPVLLLSALHALLALLAWQWLSPVPVLGPLWAVALALVLSQGAGVGVGMLFCGLQVSRRSALSLLALLAPLLIALLLQAAADAPWWSLLLPAAQALHVVDRAWWLPPSLGVDWPALRALAVLALQAGGLLALGGWLLASRAFLPWAGSQS